MTEGVEIPVDQAVIQGKAEQAPSQLPELREKVKPATNFDRFIASLEGPKEGDEGLLQQLKEHENQGGDAYEFLGTHPDIKAAYERQTNPQLKEQLPHIVDALSFLVKQYPKFNTGGSENRDYYYTRQRSEDLQRLLSMDFTPPQGTGLSQEALLYKFVYDQSLPGGLFYDGITRLRDMSPKSYAGKNPEDQATSQQTLENMLQAVEQSMSQIQPFLQERVNADGKTELDDFAELVSSDPQFYREYKTAKKFGVKSERIKQLEEQDQAVRAAEKAARQERVA